MELQKPIIYERSPEVDFLRIFKFLFQYKWLIIIITLSLSLGAFLFFYITGKMDPAKSPFPNIYRPVSQLLINDRGSSNLMSSLQNFSSLASSAGFTGAIPSSFSYGELAIRLLQSKTVLDIIASEFRISERYNIKGNIIGRSREEIVANLYTNYDDKTMLISIGYNDYDAEFASRVVNRLVELLDLRFLSIGGNRNIAQKNLLEKNLVEVKAQINSLEGEIRKFQNKYGVLDIDALAMEQVTMMARFRSQLILTEMEIKTYASFSTIEDPVIKRLNAERDNLLSLIREMESGYSEYYDILPNQQDLSDLAQEFYRLERDMNVQEKIYEILTQQYELIKLSLENTEPIFQVIEMADVPDLKIGPKRGLFCFLSAVAAGIISVALAFLYHLIKKGKRQHRKQQETATAEEIQ